MFMVGCRTPTNGPAEFVIVYDSEDDLRVRDSCARQNPIQFHVDQSPEAQTPGFWGGGFRYSKILKI